MLSCSGDPQNYAPVSNGWYPSASEKNRHTVQKGETLYAIAWRYDLDYRILASRNHLAPPYTLKTGQTLFVDPNQKRILEPTPPPQKIAPVKQYVRSEKPNPQPIAHVESSPVSGSAWIWPAEGKIVASYAPWMGRKGLDISGNLGSPIRAAGSGVVAYSGDGLRGYGNLIIIKHNNAFLSAYAHNQKNLVKEGQSVQAGQIIAEMGKSESKTVGLHFEIRKAGKPVNPLMYVKPKVLA